MSDWITTTTLSLFLWHTIIGRQVRNAFHSCLRSGTFTIAQRSLSSGSFLNSGHQCLLQSLRICNSKRNTIHGPPVPVSSFSTTRQGPFPFLPLPSFLLSLFPPFLSLSRVWHVLVPRNQPSIVSAFSYLLSYLHRAGREEKLMQEV